MRTMTKERNETVIGSRLGEFEEKRSKQKLLKLKIVRYGSQKRGNNGRDNQKHQETVIVIDLAIRKHFPENASQSMGWKNYSFENSSANLPEIYSWWIYYLKLFVSTLNYLLSTKAHNQKIISLEENNKISLK
ncbi:hypothetical protein K0M31_016725 [Melipona bicolor]|uniref:Uncharacterized protein n=1 Tax=Melipona bicolor TaxID=60889 RepID=A0AA40KEQ1_9HYME|nr:hypothetical protein K0M31_016725 [Melipona bicolor]